MTKITQLKKLRKYLPELLKPEFAQGVERVEYECPVCGGPMPLSPGQIQGCHKECKPQFKRFIRKAQKKERKQEYDNKN